MHALITRTLSAAAAAATALLTLAGTGAGPAGAASTVPRSISPPAYGGSWAGYLVGGRWFRFISTTLSWPGTYGDSMMIGLSHGAPAGQPFAELEVDPGNGTHSMQAHTMPGGYGWLSLSPRAGDQVAISIYYDQHGHDAFTASDLTQHITRTVRLTAGSAIYDYGFVVALGGWPQFPPQADTRLLAFTGSHVTTYSGGRGTITGPWVTRQVIATTTGTAAGTVVASSSALWDGGANFGAWLRALPKYYTNALAGYQASGGPFRFAAATLTVPPAQVPAANGGSLTVGLGNCCAAHLVHATIGVQPGGGTGSISYSTNTASGTFTVSPQAGDQLTASVYYDRHGHYSFTVTDATQHASQTVTANAVYGNELSLAGVYARIDNQAVVPPPADIQLWAVTGTAITTSSGLHGSILGPWAIVEYIDTTTSGPAGQIVLDAPVLSNDCHNFGVWLRHR